MLPWVLFGVAALLAVVLAVLLSRAYSALGHMSTGIGVHFDAEFNTDAEGSLSMDSSREGVVWMNGALFLAHLMNVSGVDQGNGTSRIGLDFVIYPEETDD